MKVAITGVGPDKPGIVAGLTRVLFNSGCNIEDSSMTILEREFTVILIVSLPEHLSVDDLRCEFAAVEDALGLTIFIKPLEELSPKAAREEEAIPYMISVSGEDRTGITYHVSQLLEEFDVNITDLNAQIIAGEEGPVYIMMVEADVRPSIGIPRFEAALLDLAKRLNVEIGLRTIDPLTL